MKYILYKHKPGKSGWYIFSATTALKIAYVFSVRQLQKESFNDLFDQWRTYYISTSLVRLQKSFMHTSHRLLDVFPCNFSFKMFWISMKSRRHKSLRLFNAGWNCYWKICVSLTFYNMVFSRTFFGWGFYSSSRLS